MKDEPFDWGLLISHSIHPIRIAAVEAMRWIEEPFSAVDLKRMHEEDPPSVEVIAYHLRVLATELPMFRVYETERIRGATRRLYFFRHWTPVSQRSNPAP